jgi:hypothetical protein
MLTEECRNFPRRDIESILKTQEVRRMPEKKIKAKVTDIMSFFRCWHYSH